LGELFLGTYSIPSETRSAKLISEQVSHHPPVTAYHIITPYGITLTGHNGADLSFSGGTIVVKQTGHAQLVITLADSTTETFYITLPELRIRGLTALSPYVELDKSSYIVSSTGYLAKIDYSGRGWFAGTKNSFTATLSQGDSPPLYTVTGQWTGEATYTSHKNVAHKAIPFWNAKFHDPTHVVVCPLEKQSEWESRRVWHNVASAIEVADVETAGRYKSAIEIGQRKMREEEAQKGETWKQRFFRWVDRDEVASELRAILVEMGALNGLGEVGSWVFATDEEDGRAVETGELFGCA
jgi:oxysterol-binding protein-related protein 9/10/11